MLKLLVIIVSWFAMGIIPYGLILGSFTKKFPEQSNIGVAIFALVQGPIALITATIFCLTAGECGFQLVPYSKEQRLSIFLQKYPKLGKEYFDARY